MGTGGFRVGAGRPGWRRKCESCLPLDIRKLQAHDCLRPGWFSWEWSRDGERTGSVSVLVNVCSLELSYTWTPHGGDPRPIRLAIPLTRTPCRFGGSRPWFLCPWCHRRCAVLYGLSGDGYFGCRLCMRLCYASECEDRMSRLWRKERKLESRLDGDCQKPKWMRWRTYERIRDRLGAVEEAKEIEFTIGAARLLARLGEDPLAL